MCTVFLQTGTCPAGSSCDLSHEPAPERVPACVHFVRGHCSNDQCRYAHVRVNPGAAVCERFANYGYCEAGATCEKRHVHECPDYANAGACNNKKCRLPHIDRAGQIRKKQGHGRQKDDDAMPEDSDVSSEDDDHEEIDSDDVDSDGLADEAVEIASNPSNHDVSKQRDFIHF